MAQQGDQEAFAQVYDVFVDPVYRYVYYRVNKEDVEDVVENVFLKVWENLRKYRVKKNKSFSAWIFRIAHNLVVDYYRLAKTRDFDELDETFVDDNRQHNPIRKTENTLDKDLLKKAMSGLKKRYQEIIIYKFINDLSNKEIAEIMKKSEGSLRIMQFRALKALKREFEEMGVEFNI